MFQQSFMSSLIKKGRQVDIKEGLHRGPHALLWAVPRFAGLQIIISGITTA